MSPVGDSSTAQFLLAMRRMQERTDSAQQQINSGLRVEEPSDSPQDVGTILQLQAQIADSQQSRANMDRFRAEVDQGEIVLQAAVDVLDQARVIGAQASNDVSLVRRVSLAEAIKGLLDKMVGLSRSSVESRFIFSGGNDQLPAYELNLLAPGGVRRLIEMTPARAVANPLGGIFASTKNAQEIFDPRDPTGQATAANAFDALNSLRIGLESDDGDAIRAAMDKLAASSQHVNQQLAHYGQLQTSLQSSTDLANRFEVNWKAQLSSIRDTDVPAAIVELTRAQTQRDAAIQAEAQRPRSSLFDYLR
jgi:flagellar hook-associated protein 3 FlgL